MDFDAVPLLGRDRTSHFWGERLCLATVNTVFWRRGPAPQDHLDEYDVLLELVDRAGWLVDRAGLETLAAADPDAAERAVVAGRVLRELMLAVFSAVAAGEAPPADALAAVQDEATQGLSGLRLTSRPDGAFGLVWPDLSIELPIRQIATSAMLLLISPEIDRLKQCPGPTCGWVFLDASRNRSRRWCSSDECGNRHRARQHYQRVRAVTGPTLRP